MKRLLIDTHCWLWLLADHPKLSKAARELLSAPSTELYLSAASAWEIAIKYGLGKLPLPLPPADYVPDRMLKTQTQALPILHTHALHAAALPLHHSDPFDRLIISQALVENLPIMTADPQFEAYGAKVIAA